MLGRWVDQPDVHDNPAVEMLKDHYWQGDPFMDPFVVHLRQTGMRTGRQMLEHALDYGIDAVLDAPAELVALFEHLDNPPSWYDAKKWERGRRLWNNASFSGLTAMAIQDAIGTFVGAEVSTAVGMTGRFVNDRRNLETAQWFNQITNPGALDRFADEFKATVRVRLMHSQVRVALMNSWSAEEYARHGNPISTAMTMVAGATFGLIPVLLDDRMGRRASWDDLDAITHYWGYICYVFGVAPEIIPTTAVEALDIMNYGVATAGGPSRWTAKIWEATGKGLRSMPGLRGRLSRAAVTPVLGVMSFFAGEALIRALVQGSPYQGVRLQPWCALTEALVRIDVTSRRIDDALPGAQRRRNRRAGRGDFFEDTFYKFLRARARRLGPVAYTQHDDATMTGCLAFRG
jgi:ER-bound oxygenase mpaB/B'/Rubber oxygenase, catalytic domain